MMLLQTSSWLRSPPSCHLNQSQIGSAPSLFSTRWCLCVPDRGDAKERLKSFDLACEDAQDKDQWRMWIS